jgi:hypothetical protein
MEQRQVQSGGTGGEGESGSDSYAFRHLALESIDERAERGHPSRADRLENESLLHLSDVRAG